MLSTILIVLLILILIGALPRWGYSGNWGYGPGGIVGILLIVVIVLALTGRLLTPSYVLGSRVYDAPRIRVLPRARDTSII